MTDSLSIDPWERPHNTVKKMSDRKMFNQTINLLIFITNIQNVYNQKLGDTGFTSRLFSDVLHFNDTSYYFSLVKFDDGLYIYLPTNEKSGKTTS